MESSIAEFLKRKLACELLPTLDCVVLFGAEHCVMHRAVQGWAGL